ncbi:MAG: flagellar basal body L-ring protein FlgH [Planctomycetaceae bacterium]|nr:flagellar basal body L-ring protein FlgH [Planctomycetaceae bacterium]
MASQSKLITGPLALALFASGRIALAQPSLPPPPPSDSAPQQRPNGPVPGSVRPQLPPPQPTPYLQPPYASYADPQSYEDFGAPRGIQQLSMIYVQPPPPREIKVHDLVTIVVNEKSQVTMNSTFNRQRNATYKAQLKEFLRIGKTGNLRPAAEEDQPTIDTNLQGRLQTTGILQDNEGMTFRIQAEVAEVLPNGVLVLEARKQNVSNREAWEYTFTGKARAEDVNKDNTILSERVANQVITKKSKGKVYDSTSRPWGTRLWDKLFPF